MSGQTPLQENDVQSAQILKDEHQQEKVKSTVTIGLVKVILAIAVLVGGIWASDSINGLSSVAKIALPIISGIVAIFILLIGNFRRLIKYFGASIIEFKKVVWPTQQYAIRMTGFVILFVAALSVFIYGVDTLIWLFFDKLMK